MKQSNLLLSWVGLLAAIQAVGADNNAAPYEVIPRENAFRLSPPTEAKPPVLMVERREITFQGVTTILGRAQVLLNIQLKSTRTPGISCVLSENENHDGVTILEIDVRSGTVRLNNLGLEQILALKR